MINVSSRTGVSQWQMDILRKTGDYWTGFTKLELFKDLMETMREGK